MARPETRKDRFVRLAERRTQRVLDSLRLIGNLANRSNYEYSDADVKKIFAAIELEVKIAREKFQKSDKDRPGGFKLT